ncbi:MAG: helix-turn-helix domain-containing protein, partial [Candidatus Dormibacteria bacterium]
MRTHQTWGGGNPMTTDPSHHHLNDQRDPEPREEIGGRPLADIGYIAERVIAARRRQGKTQEALAAQLGMTPRWVQYLEGGRLSRIRAIEQGAPPLPRALKILRAVALAVSIDLDMLLQPPDVVPVAALMEEVAVSAAAAEPALLTPPP